MLLGMSCNVSVAFFITNIYGIHTANFMEYYNLVKNSSAISFVCPNKKNWNIRAFRKEAVTVS